MASLSNLSMRCIAVEQEQRAIKNALHAGNERMQKINGKDLARR